MRLTLNPDLGLVEYIKRDMLSVRYSQGVCWPHQVNLLVGSFLV